MFNALK